ncbi:MAG: hypothetical protein J5882_07735 [Bacteroidales bacterium]|nr:hypothetical protein [Bacteroidales bacterium]
MESEGIIFVKNQDINRRKWDSAVSQSPYNSLFGYSWYLDSVCRTWDALITADYKQVMPIPVFDPKATQMQQYLVWTGIYGAEIPTEKDAEKFINHIPESYSGIYLNLNKFCNIDNVENGLIRQDKIYQIDLIQPYKSRRFQTPPTPNKRYSIDIKQCLSFFLANNYKTDTMTYYRMIKEVKQRGHCMIFAIANPEKIILGCAVIFMTQTEIYITDISINKNQRDIRSIKNEILDTIINYFSGKNFTMYIKTNKRGAYDSFDHETLDQFDAQPYTYIYYVRNSLSKLYNFFNIK